MTLMERNILWNILTKYDGILTSMCDSISIIIQSNEKISDYVNIFSNYQNMEPEDTRMIDQVIGKNILMCIN